MTLVRRALVILRAAPTYLVALSVIVTVAAPQIADVFPSAAEDIATWGLRVASWLTASVTIIRRVTPVPVDQRGILPQT